MEQDLLHAVEASSEDTRAALAVAAEAWNAAWEATSRGGRLHLPVLAGIRRGRLLAEVEVRPTAGGSEVRMRIEHAEYEINRPALLFLVLGALGGAITVLWPLYPERLLGFLPLGVVLLLGAWLLVASRLRTASARDFLDMVAELAEEEPEEG